MVTFEGIHVHTCLSMSDNNTVVVDVEWSDSRRIDCVSMHSPQDDFDFCRMA